MNDKKVIQNRKTEKKNKLIELVAHKQNDASNQKRFKAKR